MAELCMLHTLIRCAGLERSWRRSGLPHTSFSFPIHLGITLHKSPFSPSEVKACLWDSYWNHWPVAINQRHVFIYAWFTRASVAFGFFTDVGWGEGKVLTLLIQDGKHGNENNALKHQRWPGMIVTPWCNSLNGLLSMTLGVIQVIPGTNQLLRGGAAGGEPWSSLVFLEGCLRNTLHARAEWVRRRFLLHILKANTLPPQTCWEFTTKCYISTGLTVPKAGWISDRLFGILQFLGQFCFSFERWALS